MSIAKRVLALAAASATALVLGGVLGTSHQATRVDAAGPQLAAIGCANSNVNTDIAFAAVGGVLANNTPNNVNNNQTGFTAGSLSVINPTGVVECGAVFQDVIGTAAQIAAGDAPAIDADPNTIDGGTITYNLGASIGIAQILESNALSAGINCGSATPPTGAGALGAGAVAGVAQVVTVTLTGATGGTFTLTFNGQTTGPLAFNATPAAVQAALAALPAIVTAGGVVVTQPGGAGTPFVVTFVNNGPQAPITANGAGLTPAAVAGASATATQTSVGVPPNQPSTYTLLVNGATGGTFTLTIGGVTTGPIPFNSTAQTVVNALNAATGGVFTTPVANALVNVAPGIGLATASPGFTGPLTVNGGALTPAPVIGATIASPITTTGVAPVGVGVSTFAIVNPGGLESCQSGVANAAGTLVSPSPGNIIHVAFRAGATFQSIGTATPFLPLSATYQRFTALNGAVFTGVGAFAGTVIALGPNTLSTGIVNIQVILPIYAMTLTPSPATIPAASGTGTGSTITAALFRQVTTTCVPLALGSGFAICTAAGGAAISTNAATNFVAGSEPGVVTFTTSSGVFGSTSTAPGAFAQQIFSTHCGAVPGTAPFILTPVAGFPAASSISLASCLTATAQLFGGGAAGTATVTADFVGDFTGASAAAATTVALSPTAATVNLSRGCNEVITPASVANGATVQTIVGLVQGTSVVSVWRFNNSTKAFEAGFFSTAGAPTDFSTTGPNQSLFICVSGSGTFPTGAF